MQTHYAECVLQGTEGPEVRAIFAVQPDRKAIVFVHGYGGDSLTTWSQFDLLIPRNSAAAGHDLFFYGYDGLRAELVGSADLLRSFLEKLLVKPSALTCPNLPAASRLRDYQYQDVTIAAHSLGAVLARWAVLQPQPPSWQTRTRLVLFAPADTGARAAELALEAVRGFPFLGPFAAIAARYHSPLIDQLKPDSKELSRLKEDTVRAVDAGFHHVIAHKVFIAEYEGVVYNLKLCPHDPEPTTIAGATHKTVCKPKENFRAPLDALLACL